MEAKQRTEVFENVIRELHTNYVAPEKIKSIEAALRAKLQSGNYDKVETRTRFASALTQDLREASNDLHLFVTYDPDLEKLLLTSPRYPSVKLKELPPSPKTLSEMRSQNFDFRKLEILPGNVGYLELRSFRDLDNPQEPALTAMHFLAHAEAEYDGDHLAAKRGQRERRVVRTRQREVRRLARRIEDTGLERRRFGTARERGGEQQE